MCKKRSLLFILQSLIIPFLLSCSNTPSPFTAPNANVSIILENSSGVRSTDQVTDTVDKAIRLGVRAYLPSYINSVTVSIAKGAADTDTVVTFRNPSTWTDTQWFAMTLRSAGTRTVSVIAFIQGAPNCTATATITIVGRPSTITYNGNGNTGGTVPVDANTYQQGASVTVMANTGALVRTGYTFAGWNTAADGTGASYAGGETFTMGAAAATLYAKWTQNPTYTVSYDGNGNMGGTAPTDANVYLQSATVTVLANSGNLARTGYTFAGWNTAADGTGTSYAGGATFAMGAINVTLYANWTQNPTYTVTYSGNGNTGGAVPADANAYEQGASVIVKANIGTLVKTGFTFAGWNTAADGNGTAYAGNAIFNIGGVNVTLYANWTQNQTYTVTYSGNAGTSGSAPLDANAYEQGATVTVKANTGTLAKTGYAFAGWNTAADGNGTSYAGGETFNIGNANVILYAKWTQNATYTVTYIGNGSTGGSAPTDANAYEQGATVTVMANIGNMARTGYTFAGWNTAADGTGNSYAGTATFAMGAANVTLYAKWTQNPTYTVVYNGNGGTSGTAPADANAYVQGSVVTVKANTGNLIRSGYTFAGWNTAADGTGTSYAGAATFTMGTANVTLYAKWTQNPTYTVTYNGNANTGGAAPADANAYEQGVTVTVKDNTGNLVRTGYTFAGWNTAADGTGTSYAAAATFAMGTSNVTLYAKWTQVPTFTVTYNGNGSTGGTAPADANAYVQGASVTVKANTGVLVRTAYTFAGWNTAVDGTGTSYAGGESFNIGAANVTLYAKWTQNPTYTVTYNGNSSTGGTVPADANAYVQGATVTVIGNTGNLVRTGYTFAGWNTAADGTGTSYAGAATFTMGAANITLYAKWTQNPTYSVTYNANGGTSGTAPTDANAYLQGATVIVKGNTGNLARPGYTFAGWNTAADGTGTSYAAAATFTMAAANITLYAKWTLIPTFAVTYIANGGDATQVPIDANAYQQGATVTVKAPGAMTKTGYTFAGWNTAADGTGTSYNAAATFAMGTANVTLYAKWSLIPTYTVTYNANGGDASQVPVDANTYQQGATVTVKAAGAMTRTGYTFAGWNTANDGTGTSYAAAATFTMGNANVLLYAKWTINQYTLTLSSVGGTITAPLTSSITVNYGVATTITVVPNSGYKFVNWSVTSGTPTIANTALASTTVQLTSGNASVKANCVPLCQWTEVTTESPGNQVRAFATIGNNVFAGTYIKGAFVSTNNGTTWTPVDNGFTDSYDSIIQCLAISGSKIYAGTSGGYIWVADNSGINTTWTLADNNGLTSANVISLGVNGPTLFAGVSGYIAGVLESVDGAKNWSNNGSLGYNVSCYAVNGNNTFAGTFGYGVYVSPDNGASWNAVNNGLGNLNVLALARSSVYILAGTSGGGIYISSNNGTLWAAANSGLPANAVVQSLAVSGTNILAGTIGNGVYLSMDYGASWIPVNSGLTNTNVWSLGVSGGNIVAGTENGGIFVSPVP